MVLMVNLRLGLMATGFTYKIRPLQNLQII
jgi:hypothetical protein